MAAGLLDSAVPIFESLEAWDKLATAYRLANRPLQAETVIRERLTEEPDSPKLLCAMGDLTKDVEWFERAWEVSGKRYARAMRSLGRVHLGRQNLEKAAECFNAALALNALYPDSWFSLGYC